MDKEENSTQNDYEFLLPNGEILRTILVRQELTESNLKSIVKEKGVFLSKYEKDDTIPVLMRTLLSPSEYDSLREMQKFKVKKKKYRTSQIPWQGGKDLLSQLPRLNLNEILKERYKYDSGYELKGVPSFSPVNHRKDKVELDFTIEQQSDIKSIHNRKKEYKGSLTIEIKSDGQLHLHSTKNFTSKGTYDLVDAVAKRLEKHFKAEGTVDKEDSYERIMFNHFDNFNRFSFFLQFLNDIDFLKFKRVVDLSVSPDPDKDIPKEAKEFLKNIENLNIKGRALRKHILLSNKELRNSILLRSIIIQYNFLHSEGEGICEVEYSFPDFKLNESDKAEFQFFIGKISLNKNYRAFAKKEKIEKSVFEKVDEHKMFHYNNLKL